MSTEPTKKEITVKIDTSATEQRIKADYEAKLAEKDETIKSLLSSHKSEFMEGEQKPAPKDGEGCSLEANEKARNGEPIHEEKFRVSIDGSYIGFDMVRGRTQNEVIEKIELLANSECDNKADYQKLMSKLTRKIIHGDKPLSIEFHGSSKDFLKHSKPISEFDSSEVKAQKNAYNEKLRANRQNWTAID